MYTIDTQLVNAPRESVWPAAAMVENWPSILPHYRRVTRLSGKPLGEGTVEMAAWRPFGIFKWPTWWRSQIAIDAAEFTVRYKHIAGTTAGMDVIWRLDAVDAGSTMITIEHWWHGPRWPLISGLVANLVIGPVFVHGIASRTLAGIARAVEGHK